MAGHGNERAPQAIGHVLDEPRLPASRRPLQHHRHATLGCNREQPDLAPHFGIKRLARDPIPIDLLFLPFRRRYRSPFAHSDTPTLN